MKRGQTFIIMNMSTRSFTRCRDPMDLETSGGWPGEAGTYAGVDPGGRVPVDTETNRGWQGGANGARRRECMLAYKCLYLPHPLSFQTCSLIIIDVCITTYGVH